MSVANRCWAATCPENGKTALGSQSHVQAMTLTDKVKIIEESLAPSLSPEKFDKNLAFIEQLHCAQETHVVKLLKKKSGCV